MCTVEHGEKAALAGRRGRLANALEKSLAKCLDNQMLCWVLHSIVQDNKLCSVLLTLMSLCCRCESLCSTESSHTLNIQGFWFILTYNSNMTSNWAWTLHVNQCVECWFMIVWAVVTSYSILNVHKILWQELIYVPRNLFFQPWALLILQYGYEVLKGLF